MTPGDAPPLTAVLLCGGKGERLRPFTESVPKPLVPLRGRPLLDHLLTFLAGQGIRRFVLCAGYRAEQITRFAAERARPGLEIRCVDSGEAAMADRILDARPHIPGPALVCYGDTLANVDVAALRRQHDSSGDLATVTVHALRCPFGIVDLAEGTTRVRGLVEKPVLPYWINIGFIQCRPEALDLLERGTDLVHFLSSVASRGRLSAFLHGGKHLTVNTERERTEAETDIEFFTLPEGEGP